MSTAGSVKTKVVSIPQSNRVDISESSDEELFFEHERISTARIKIIELDCISLGIILTRSTSLNSTFKDLGIYSKYGASTTHMDKLIRKVEGGGAGGCPLILIGITSECING